MSYLILVNKQSQLVAIEAPKEPEEPNYGDCEMEASDLDMKPSVIYKQQMDLWTKDMIAYEQALQSAIDDESKHIHFKDDENSIMSLVEKIVPKELLKVGQTFQIPEGWRLSFQYERLSILSGHWVSSNKTEFDSVNGDSFIVRKLAFLEKTSERVEHSVFRQVEDGFIGTHYGVTKPENSAHSFTEGSDKYEYQSECLCTDKCLRIANAKCMKPTAVAEPVKDDYEDLAARLHSGIRGTDKEYIICAAVHFESNSIFTHQPKNITHGFVICGRRHHNCFTSVFAITSKRYKEIEQGFLTSKDRFVSRKEAGEIAFSAGQTKELKTCLFSEDLY